MSIHIGKEIHKLVKMAGLKTKIIANFINASESSVYKIYNRETIDIDKLIKLSQLLNTNLFELYLDEEPLKSMANNNLDKLSTELDILKSILNQKEKRISELESINSSQQKIIDLLEKNIIPSQSATK